VKQPVPWIRSVPSLIQTPTWARPSRCARCDRHHATWWTGRAPWCKPRKGKAGDGEIVTDPATAEALGLPQVAADMRAGKVAALKVYSGATGADR
jgi:hypothetical protein